MNPPAVGNRASGDSSSVTANEPTPGQEQHDAWASAPLFRRYVGDPGAQLHLYEAGSPEGAPVVLLHRRGATAEVWGAMSRLGSWGARLLAPDLPGCGQSDPVSEQGAGELAAYLLDALGRTEPRAVLMVAELDAVGLAVEMVLAEPARTAGLVLVAPSISAGDEVLDRLERVQVPVWVAVGEHAHPGVESTTTPVPGARWLVLPEAGADPVTGSPDLVLDLVHGALAEGASGSGQDGRRYITWVSPGECSKSSLSR